MKIILNCTTVILSSFAMLSTISTVSSHRYVERHGEIGNASCSPLLCAHSQNTSDTYATCDSKLHDCKCFENEWNSPMSCPQLNTYPLSFFYEKNNRFLGFHCKSSGLREKFLPVSEYIARFLDAIVPWNTLEITQCCAPKIPYGIIGKGDKDFLPYMENLFSTLNLSIFPAIHRTSIALNFQLNCLANITGKFSTAFPNAMSIKLYNNLLTAIPEGTFSDLPFMQYIDLRFNRIALINRSAFENLTSLTYLDLSNNDITNITEDAFTSLINLRVLKIEHNRLETLPAATLLGNQKIEEIYLTKNAIKVLPGHIFKDLFKLAKLDLSHNQIQNIAEELLFGLGLLNCVLLNNNRISVISPIQFTSNFDIRKIDLSNNNLLRVPSFNFTWALTKAPEIFIKANKIQTLDIPLVSNIMQATKVDLSQNHITTYHKKLGQSADIANHYVDNLICQKCGMTSIPAKMLDHVKSKADFSNNLISKIDMELLRNIAHLDQVYLVKNNISTIALTWSYPIIQDDNMPTKNPLTELVLKNNGLNCDCRILTLLRFLDKNFKLPNGMTRSNVRFQLSDVICKEPADLRGLSVTYLVNDDALKTKLVCNVTLGCPPLCNCYHIAVEDVTVVNCSNRRLEQFPKLMEIDGELVVHLQHNQIENFPSRNSMVWDQIRELNLNGNKIQNLENLTITSTLKLLDLQNNGMTDLSDVVNRLVLPNPNVSVTLANNPWECNCKVQQVRPLLFSAENVRDVNRISCYLPYSEDSVLLTNVTDYQLCPELVFSDEQRLVRFLVPALAAVVVLISVCLTILYRYKEEVQLWLFTRGYCLKFVAEEDIDGEKTYDAFVSYSSIDEEWVANSLVPGLEQGAPSYKLCLHDRDWLGGEWIPEQIFRSVQFSRRTIIVLTDNFIESDWSRLEFHAAYRQALTDQVNRVLIVVPGEVPDINKMDHELRAYVTLNTYIKWGDSNFWRKLRCAMPKTMASPKSNYVVDKSLLKLDPYSVSPYGARC